MQTVMWDIRTSELKTEQAKAQLREISEALRDGEVIGIPTETVYGLAADARSDAAIERVFQAKDRPADNPLIVHIHSMDQLDDFIEDIDDKVRVLMKSFWPGAISFILPLKSGVLSTYATAGLQTVAVRMPAHPVARAVLSEADIPLAAPSANTSGRPSPTDGAHVLDDLGGKIFGVINSEPSDVGLESTVLDCTMYPYRIVRPGSVTKREIEKVLKDTIYIDGSQSDTPISPGMKYKHYAPSQPVKIIENWTTVSEHINQESSRVGIIAPASMQQYVDARVLFIKLCRDAYDYNEASRNLYRALREMDDSEVDVIYLHGFNQNDESAALNNRIYRAAGKRIIEG